MNPKHIIRQLIKKQMWKNSGTSEKYNLEGKQSKGLSYHKTGFSSLKKKSEFQNQIKFSSSELPSREHSTPATQPFDHLIPLTVTCKIYLKPVVTLPSETPILASGWLSASQSIFSHVSK